MLIGIDASRANRKFKGGTEWYSYNLIQELAKIDSKNQYVLYSDKPLTGGLADLVATRDNFRSKVLRWPLTFFWTQLRLSLEMFVYPPDLLFIPAHTLPVIHPKRSLITIHDIGFERARELYSSEKIGPRGGPAGNILGWSVGLFTGCRFRANILDYHRWSTRYAIKRAKKIIAVSDFTKREMIDLCGAPDSKIAVVYNGYNAEIYKKIADREKIDKILDKYGIKPPYILYVGRLEKKKNTARLINAFAIMKERNKNINQRLVLVGSAGLDFDEVKYSIEEFDLNNEVIVTGWLPAEDMPYIYNGASLFVFPSLYEGFGIPLLEAMATGVPIAAARSAAIPEIASKAAWLFDPKNEHDMAEKMAAVLSDKRLADDLIGQGRARVKDFSLEKCARETLAVMENI